MLFSYFQLTAQCCAALPTPSLSVNQTPLALFGFFYKPVALLMAAVAPHFLRTWPLLPKGLKTAELMLSSEVWRSRTLHLGV
ncbi:hypothetical protein AAHA92_05357 [Salvia divinorum]|uniref:Uncharacterized protein n=1 Tax=Salvia divinorum TaxID=28513 RepID=A0ABD1I5F1_SALDI